MSFNGHWRQIKSEMGRQNYTSTYCWWPRLKEVENLWRSYLVSNYGTGTFMHWNEHRCACFYIWPWPQPHWLLIGVYSLVQNVTELPPIAWSASTCLHEKFVKCGLYYNAKILLICFLFLCVASTQYNIQLDYWTTDPRALKYTFF